MSDSTIDCSVQTERAALLSCECKIKINFIFMLILTLDKPFVLYVEAEI